MKVPVRLLGLESITSAMTSRYPGTSHIRFTKLKNNWLHAEATNGCAFVSVKCRNEVCEDAVELPDNQGRFPDLNRALPNVYGDSIRMDLNILIDMLRAMAHALPKDGTKQCALTQVDVGCTHGLLATVHAQDTSAMGLLLSLEGDESGPVFDPRDHYPEHCPEPRKTVIGFVAGL